MLNTTSYCSRSLRISEQWQNEHNLNEEVIKKKRITLGRRVKTEHGEGKVVGRDHPYRVIVEITKPEDKHKRMVSSFEHSRLCYFPKEILIIDSD